MSKQPIRALAFAAFALTAGALFAATSCAGSAATATATRGLAPQFSTWPVPLYGSHVTDTQTWAPNSYEIATSDSVDHVLGWYLGKLKDRAMQIPHHHAGPSQIAVDGGAYIINVLKSTHGASINVLKN